MPYEPKRLPLIEALESRDTTTNFDSKLVNALAEKADSGVLRALKRPGNHLAFTGTAGTGQGITNYLNSLYSVSGDFINSFASLAGLTAIQSTAAANWQRRTGAAGIGFGGKLWLFGGQLDPAVATPTFSATVSGGSIQTIPITFAGLGYYPGYPTTINLTITGGGGINGAATATISGQSVLSVNITNAGTGYTSPPTVTASATGWGMMNDVWNSVDGINWTKVNNTAAWGQRQYAQVAVFNGAMYLTGGVTGFGTNVNDKTYSDVWFSTDGVTWTQATANAWKGRFNHGIEVFNNKLWVAGGAALVNTTSNSAELPTTSYSDVYSSADGVNWVQTNANSPWVARSSFGFFTVNNLLWVVGGKLIDSFIGATADSWSSPDGIVWTRVSSNPFNVAASGVFPLAAISSPGSAMTIPPPVTVSAGAATAYAFTDFDDDGDDDDFQGGGLLAVTFNAAGSGYTSAPTLTFGATIDNPAAYAFLNGAANSGGKYLRVGRIGNTAYLLEFFNSTAGYAHVVWSTTDGVTYTNLGVNFGAGWPVRDGTWITYGNLWEMGGINASTYYNDVWFISLGGTSTALSPNVAAGFYHFTQTSTSIATPLLVFKSTKDLYSYNASLNILTKLSNAANYPATTVPGIVYLDGYFFVMDPQGRIWNSAINDPGTWTALGFLSMQNEPNGGVAIAKLATFVIGFGVWTIEFFFDNANAAPASPLSPQITLPIQTGCAAGESVVDMQSTLVWIGQTRHEAQGVYKFDGYNPVRISTPFVDRIIQNDPLTSVRAYSLDMFGHPCYVLLLNTTNICLVFDFTTGMWSVFTGDTAQGTKTVNTLTCDPYGLVTANAPAHGYADGDPVVISGASTTGYNGAFNISLIDSNNFQYNAGAALGANAGTAVSQGYSVGPFSYVAGAEVTGVDYVQDPTSGQIYAQTIFDYSDHGLPVDMQIVTNRWDAGTSGWKFVARISLPGDMVASSALIAYSDNDYQSFGKYRLINLNTQRPSITPGGRTRRRAYKVRHTAATPFRAEALEFEFYLGSA